MEGESGLRTEPAGCCEGEVARHRKGCGHSEQPPDPPRAEAQRPTLPTAPQPHHQRRRNSCDQQQIGLNRLQQASVEQGMGGAQAPTARAQKPRRLMKGAARKKELPFRPVEVQQGEGNEPKHCEPCPRPTLGSTPPRRVRGAGWRRHRRNRMNSRQPTGTSPSLRA